MTTTDRRTQRDAAIRSGVAHYLTDNELATRYGVHRATIWRWVQEGRLPKPVKLSPGCSRFPLSEVESREASLRAA